MSEVTEQPPPPAEADPSTSSPPASSPSIAPTEGGWRKALPVVLTFGVTLALAIAYDALPVFLFVVALLVIVMLHEAGHFIAAKWSGMKVTEYFFGFGPRLWSFRKGETEYGIKAIPAGGYVKILGMSNMEEGIDPADEPRTYRQQSFRARLAVGLAGIAMHFVIAFILLVVVWALVGVPNYDLPSRKVEAVTRFEDGPSPALAAGFRAGDEVVAVDGHHIHDFSEIGDYIQGRPGTPVTFDVERDGQLLTLTAVPVQTERDGENVGVIGISQAPAIETTDPLTALGRSGKGVFTLSWGSMKALGTFFSADSLGGYADQVFGNASPDANRPVSVVGVGRIADQAADEGTFEFLSILIVLNLFLAVFNLVPLLPLDGGHVAVAIYERIRSRPGRRYHADVSKLMPLTAAVVVFIVLLGLTSLWLDITSPVGNPFE